VFLCLLANSLTYYNFPPS